MASNSNATRTGSSKVTLGATTLSVQHSATEIKERVANPAHAPGKAGNIEAFDVTQPDGSTKAVPVDISTVSAVA